MSGIDDIMSVNNIQEESTVLPESMSEYSAFANESNNLKDVLSKHWGEIQRLTEIIDTMAKDYKDLKSTKDELETRLEKCSKTNEFYGKGTDSIKSMTDYSKVYETDNFKKDQEMKQPDTSKQKESVNTILQSLNVAQ